MIHLWRERTQERNCPNKRFSSIRRRMIPLQVTHQIQEHIEEKEVEEKRREEDIVRVVIVLEEVVALLVQVLIRLLEVRAVQNVKVSLRREGIIAITHKVVIT